MHIEKNKIKDGDAACSRREEKKSNARCEFVGGVVERMKRRRRKKRTELESLRKERDAERKKQKQKDIQRKKVAHPSLK